MEANWGQNEPNEGQNEPNDEEPRLSQNQIDAAEWYKDHEYIYHHDLTDEDVRANEQRLSDGKINVCPNPGCHNEFQIIERDAEGARLICPRCRVLFCFYCRMFYLSSEKPCWCPDHCTLQDMDLYFAGRSDQIHSIARELIEIPYY